ncbi:inorganic diphosphatase [Candidatus Woesearchaeota archaeon]|nr:inorganic diphosphatase [Candidatus Woesearchaeota archaeon]
MHLYHDITPGTAEKLIAVIEIPKGSKVKYEVDKKTGTIAVDRILSCEAGYPENYGFVPQTHYEDGDPLDVVVVSDHALAPGTIVEVRPIGVMHMNDNGETDDKIICVIASDPAFKTTKNLTDLSVTHVEAIKHFFSTYKQKEGKKVVIDGFAGVDIIPQMIEKSIREYKAKWAEA